MAEDVVPKGVSKQRLDALSDGVFAFAMTLLVISLDLPSSAEVANSADLLELLADLQDNLLVYIISFTVLGARWLRNARGHDSEMWCSNGYAWAVIINLFFVTLVPFATKLVGLYGDLWPAICVYAATTVCAALASMRATDLISVQEGVRRSRGDRIDLAVLIVTAAISCGLAFVAPRYSMFAYLLNAACPLLRRRMAQS